MYVPIPRKGRERASRLPSGTSLQRSVFGARITRLVWPTWVPYVSGRVFVDGVLPEVGTHTVDSFGARGEEVVQPVL